ncbi:hypothetical protein PIB30_029730 [Stylosanthes scabra]|uniref:Aldose 1-epimerase n=1 Tax=Stylosanthes scabra TaxID=79078 RepID=A0ABU6Y8P1_9FABA|nr:hypothetical protein [Stylosanthes scabra]
MGKFLLVILLCVVCACGIVNGSMIKKEKDQIRVFELKKGDLTLKVTNWGATLVSLVLPDKYGKLGDIVLGYDSPQAYTNDTTYFGATVGRVANRIGGAQFTLDGIHYKLIANEGNNTLHGGPRGFSDVLWKVVEYQRDGHTPKIKLSYHSFDGEEGFPGDLFVTVTYILTEKSTLGIIMKAKALNKPTPVNLVNHAYWNLGNHNNGNVLNQLVQIFASEFTPVDDHLIPTGNFSSVKGTPYDFLKPQVVGSRIDQLPKTNGYDINYVLDKNNKDITIHVTHKIKKHDDEIRVAAIVMDKSSGRVMKIATNQPGLQFYTANFVTNEKGKDGFVYQPRSALCLETQAFPDSVNHPNFPSTIVTPEKPYKHVVFFKFSTDHDDAPRGFSQ